MTQLSLEPIYLLDASCVTRLDNKDRAPSNPPEFTSQEQACIWQGLETLASQGRMKLIKQVKVELEHWDHDGLERLVVYPGHRLIIRRTTEIVQRYQQLANCYPKLRSKPGKDKADLWLILAAERSGFTIVTQEEGLSHRKSSQRDLRIPDVCALESPPIPCIDLRQLANNERWLP